MRLTINNLTPEHPDPEDEAYWDFMSESLDRRRYDGDTRPVGIDLTMTTRQESHTRTAQVASFRTTHSAKGPVLEIHCDNAQAAILYEFLEMMSAVVRQIPKELHNEEY